MGYPRALFGTDMPVVTPNNMNQAPCNASLLSAGRPRRLGILVNPQSGTNRRSFHAMRRILDRSKTAIHRLVVKPHDVAGALAEMAAHRVEVLGVCGGDGTVHAALTALFHARPFAVKPPVVLIAGGTTNMTAADVGMAGKPTRALQRLLDWAEGSGHSGQLIRRSILRVDGGPGSAPRFGMFFSAAGIAQVTRVRHVTRRRARSELMRGALGTAMTVGRYLLGLALGRRVVEPTPIAVRLDDQSYGTRNYLAVFITTLARLNPGIRPYWGDEDGPLKYTAVAYQPQGLLLAAPSFVSGRPSRYLTPESGYISRNIHEAVLQVKTACALDGQILLSEPPHVLTVSYGGEVDFVRV